MNRLQLVYRLLVAIAAVTLFSGLGQLAMPAVVLRIVGADVTPASAHFFAIVGMFMLLFGGMLLQALLSERHHPMVVFWCGLQKFGAFAAIGLGVMNAVFGPLALAVAVFDLFSGVLILWYWARIKQAGERRQVHLV